MSSWNLPSKEEIAQYIDSLGIRYPDYTSKMEEVEDQLCITLFLQKETHFRALEQKYPHGKRLKNLKGYAYGYRIAIRTTK